MAVRQEVYNVLLAQLLQERGLVAVPEQIIKRKAKSVKLPDVLVDFQGLRLIIEAEIGKTTSSRKAAYKKALERVEQAIAHVGVAVIYPKEIQSIDFSKAKQALGKYKLEYSIITEADAFPGTGQTVLFPADKTPTFSSGTLDDLADALRRSYEQLVRDETLDIVVKHLESRIDECLSVLQLQPATTKRITGVIGIASASADKKRERLAVGRIGALIIVNAMIFHEVLSKKDSRVKPLASFLTGVGLTREVCEHWQHILDDINYDPIFYTACSLLKCFSADREIDRAIKGLLNAAIEVVGWKASLRHDLAGRIYHRLLEDAKYLGAYYTSIPAATLLLKLALFPERNGYDWSDMNELGEMHIADLACGTGTLLMAAADTVADNYVRACVENGKKVDLDKLQHLCVEKILYGYDVLPSAVHLTASTLTLRIPDTPVNVTHLYKLPLGGSDISLGTLEFLEGKSAIGTLFGQSETEQVTGKKPIKIPTTLPVIDVCTMNPPFTSSRRANLLFGNIPDGDRQKMQKRLKSLVAKNKLPASITAGLGAVFVALADQHIRPGGRMALVLPRSLLSGISWERTRKLFSTNYVLEYLIVSHHPGHWNFSENTSLSEVLMVARKKQPSRDKEANEVTCVNLWRQPINAAEALGIAHSITHNIPPDIEEGTGSQQLKIGNTKFGEAISVSWSKLKDDLWSLPCAFAQSELVRALYKLRESKLYLSTESSTWTLPLCPLKEIGELGPDPRDVYDGFDLVNEKTPFPALWGHDSEQITTMSQVPNRYLRPLDQPKKGRHLRKATDLWPKAGRILIAQRPRLNTKRLSAVRLSRKVLGDVWCPLQLKEMSSGIKVDEAEKSLVLWLNSTLGLLLLFGHREETEGPWVQYKKPTLYNLPVLDVRASSRKSLAKLARTYDRLSKQDLLPFPKMAQDTIRREIDEVFADVLNIPEPRDLREMLGQEPVVSTVALI